MPFYGFMNYFDAGFKDKLSKLVDDAKLEGTVISLDRRAALQGGLALTTCVKFNNSVEKVLCPGQDKLFPFAFQVM